MTEMTHDEVESRTILHTVVGSRVLGVAVNGSDDRDEMGICIEPPEYVVGLRHFEHMIHRTQPDGVRSGPGDLDLTIYSLRKWMRLALGGNPTVIMPLFAPDRYVLRMTHEGATLRANAHRFVSRNAGNAFYGYLVSQRAQLTGERPKKHTNRPELIEQYGYDTKFAYHALRLGIQGIEFLSTGKITLPMHPIDRVALLDVRTGKYELADVVEWMNSLGGSLRDLADHMTSEPDRKWADRFLIESYQNRWEQGWGQVIRHD